jgi:hypothetical protein
MEIELLILNARRMEKAFEEMAFLSQASNSSMQSPEISATFVE